MNGKSRECHQIWVGMHVHVCVHEHVGLCVCTCTHASSAAKWEKRRSSLHTVFSPSPPTCLQFQSFLERIQGLHLVCALLPRLRVRLCGDEIEFEKRNTPGLSHTKGCDSVSLSYPESLGPCSAQGGGLWLLAASWQLFIMCDSSFVTLGFRHRHAEVGVHSRSVIVLVLTTCQGWTAVLRLPVFQSLSVVVGTG